VLECRTRAGEWALPNPKGRYARSSVFELLPDPLSPLFATLGLPAWGRATESIAQALGMAGVISSDTLTTVNDFAKPVLADDPLPVLETLKFFLGD
jgi:hypothetical protein